MKRPLLTVKKKPLSPPKEESINTPFENLKASLKTIKAESVKEVSPPQEGKKTPTPPPVKMDGQKKAKDKDKKPKRQPKPLHPILVKLCEKYPNTFHGTKRKPLKIGIHKDILEALKDDEKVTATALRKALFGYVSGYAYQRGMLMYDHRFDLEANPAGDITPDQKEFAQRKLDQRKHPAPRKTKEKGESTNTPKPDGTETPSPENLEPDKKAESVLQKE